MHNDELQVEPNKLSCPVVFIHQESDRHLPGTLSWNSGDVNSAVLSVVDGPSFTAQGTDFSEAYTAACAGIGHAGYTLINAGQISNDLQFALASQQHIEASPRFQPTLWLLVIAILAALLAPALGRAALPEYGKRLPFPNAPYDYRYEGPNYDTRDGSSNSAARMRHQAREQGVSEWRNIPLDAVIVILKRSSNEQVASYRLEGGQFCDYEDDNCDVDGIFPVIISSMKDEPVLGVVRHIGAHGQKLSILRPLSNRHAPVFEATADYALSFRLYPDHLKIITDRIVNAGEARHETLQWPSNTGSARCAEIPQPITLIKPPKLSNSAHAFQAALHSISQKRDMHGFMRLLSDDVLVSFGGNGGKTEFSEFWRLNTKTGLDEFWATLDKLISHGGWSEASGIDDDGEKFPERLTYPWFFVAWPDNADAENILISGEDAQVRAAGHASAPVLSYLPAATVVVERTCDGQRLDGAARQWREVVLADGSIGFVNQESLTALLDTRIIVQETSQGWRIEAMISGD